MVTVSVVVPSYNDAVMLRRCLEALAAQERPADEVIVVDNASDDDTAAVAREFGARVVFEPVRGIPSATAAGFDAATGDVLGRLDADSVPPRDWVRRVAEVFEQEPVDALSGPGDFYGANPVVHWIAEKCYVGAYHGILPPLLGHPILFGSNLALRRTTWVDVSPRFHRDRPDLHDDFDLAMNLDPATRMRFDHSLRVGVSSRPLGSVRALARRVRMAFATLQVNHAEEPLHRRRARWRAAHRNRSA